jgi:hypothetical protein
VHENINLLFPTADVMENIQEYSDIHSVLLSVCMAVKAIQARVCVYCRIVFLNDSIPPHQSLLLSNKYTLSS